jgi:ligand-binding sensor domain-containing protein
MNNLFLTILAILTVSCNAKVQHVDRTKIENQIDQQNDSQIGEYVVESFQDSKGNLWFGTLEEGVAKYDGNKLTYLTTNEGLPSNRIVDIVEDSSGNLWFGTGEGLSKFDGEAFWNYTERDGLCSDMISNLFIDSEGIFWIGTWGGVCTFDGIQFRNFLIPRPTIETMINQDTKDWVTSIAEDLNGNIWFGSDGYGASKFDGNNFVHFTTKEGLNSNNVQAIVVDQENNIWIGTRVAEKDNADPDKRFGKGGLNKFNGEKFIHYLSISGLYNNDVYTIYKDKTNDIWCSTISHGIYNFKNNKFLNYNIPSSTMSFLEDNIGNVWLGCAGGLFRINPSGEIINITTSGPWN